MEEVVEVYQREGTTTSSDHNIVDCHITIPHKCCHGGFAKQLWVCRHFVPIRQMHKWY